MLRSCIDNLPLMPRKELRIKCVEVLKSFLKEFRLISRDTDPKEISVPRRAETLLVCMHALLREPVLNVKYKFMVDIITNNWIIFLQSNLASVVNHIYPKIFPLHNWDVENTESYQVVSF